MYLTHSESSTSNSMEIRQALIDKIECFLRAEAVMSGYVCPAYAVVMYVHGHDV